MASNTSFEKDEESSEEWRQDRAEECAIVSCVDPVSLADGKFCEKHRAQKPKEPKEPKVTNVTSAIVARKENKMAIQTENPTSAMIAARGIKTAADFAQFMGAMMEDLVEGRIEPDVAQAACKAGAAMLQVVKMQLEYGREESDGTRTLLLGGKREKK